MSRRRWSGLVVVVLALAVLAVPSPAAAFKPYTHVVSGQTALADVLHDGAVTIAGRKYPVPERVREALQQHPAAYNAGAVGPDGFPDLTFGQSAVHPDQTGRWLDHLLTRAWQAQDDPSRSEAEKGQILAFTYGFLTHASGDLWAHTIVNDFSHGIFPPVREVVTDIDKAEIALRHVIVEGYLGDLTRGYDGNPDRTTLGDGDISDDSTPAVAFDAPHRFLYDALVDPRSPLPVGTSRGPLIDFFLDLQADLELQRAVARADIAHADCASVDPDCYERTHTVTAQTVRGEQSRDTVRYLCIGATVGCLPSPGDAADDLVQRAIEAYLDAWIADIETGLRSWSELGLASTKALFDPQAYRNAQNDLCRHHGGEQQQARIDCENSVGKTDVLFREADPFINQHLLSMLGLPDAVGDARAELQAFSAVLDDILGPALNPLRLAEAEIKEAAKTLVKDFVRASYGFDIDHLDSFLHRSTYWLDVQQASIDLGPLGRQQVDLFQPGDRARLDALLGLTAEDFETVGFRLPDGTQVTGRALKDSAEFQQLAAYDNTITTNSCCCSEPTASTRSPATSWCRAGWCGHLTPSRPTGTPPPARPMSWSTGWRAARGSRASTVTTAGAPTVCRASRSRRASSPSTAATAPSRCGSRACSGPRSAACSGTGRQTPPPTRG